MAIVKKETKIAFCYARVSTQIQAEDGISLDAQEFQLRGAAEAQGLTVKMLREEGRSGKSIQGRPVLREALLELDAGKADALFVTRLDRLSRSTRDFLSIVDRSHKYGWRLVLLDLGMDTATSTGRFIVTIMSAMAEMERGMISMRQKDVHIDRRNNGKIWGVDTGPLPLVTEDIQKRIKEERDAGISYKGIADGLNRDAVPTVLKGKQWYASTVRNTHLRNQKEA